MYYLKVEERLEIKKIAENYCVSQKIYEEKFDLLKGSLEIKQRKIVEDLLEKVKYNYENEKSSKEKEAKCFCIGKAIIILESDKRKVIDIISLVDFEFGIAEYKRNTGEFFRENMKQGMEIRERMDTLVNEFLNLSKWDKIKKGEILEEIDNILAENKNLGNKKDMWEKLKIIDSTKSMLCKRYRLFKELEKSEVFTGEKDYRKAIEEMIDVKLKEITKEGKTMEEKEEFILEEILNKGGERK